MTTGQTWGKRAAETQAWHLYDQSGLVSCCKGIEFLENVRK